jgi:hypothetical protein
MDFSDSDVGMKAIDLPVEEGSQNALHKGNSSPIPEGAAATPKGSVSSVSFCSAF